MDKRQCPKVIVTCIDSWRNDVGSNTLPDLFSSWDPDRVAVVYTKADLPDSERATRFFQISENDVLHASLHPGHKCGKVVTSGNCAEKISTSCRTVDSGVKEEHGRYAFFRNHRWKLFYAARDIMWAMGAWKSGELDRFIKEFGADAILLPIYPYVYMNKLQAYVAKKAGVRGVAYIADDNYSYRAEWYNPLFLISRFFLRRSVDQVMRYADELLVILPKLQDEYQRIFHLPTHILTKGIEASDKPFKRQTRTLPLKMVYTGNLFIGRDRTLKQIVDAIQKINSDGIKIQLYIYSHIPLTDRLRKTFDIPGSSYFMGAVSVSEVAAILDSADIVLFVEGMDMLNRNKARLSFSTKLTDYFKAGKCIFAVGPQNIAPIEYLTQNKCAVVATSTTELFSQMNWIVSHPQEIDEYGKAAYDVGRTRHSNADMKNTFYSAIARVMKKERG